MMKKFCCLFFATVLCIGFVGCNDDKDNDKDNDKSSKSLIVGTWENYKDWEEGYGYDYYEDGEYVVRFKSDGTGFWLEDGYADDGFKWELDDSYLYFYYDEDDIEVIKVKSLDKEEMVLSYNGGEYLEYYRRIN